MKPDHIWRATLGELQLQMTQATFDTWLRDSRFLRYDDGTFVIAVQSGYAKEWLESRLLPTIKRTLTRQAGCPADVCFVVLPEDHSPSTTDPLPLLNTRSQQALPAPQPSSNGLNSRYTFESFVVGPDNRLAHAASLAVSERPATAYNPLFLYGGVGLGKTHLLNAIGNACHAQGLRVLYISSEAFTNDLIEAIRSQTTDLFRDKYRTVDVLLVDDVQFIAGKESTQEEFFHTFNTLHSTGKQIVLSSDRKPKAMVTLEERLRSRFEWGLIADIQPPAFETRIAILRTKAAAYEIEIPDAILVLIAKRIQSNIRELEGVLNRMVAIATLANQPLTLDIAEATLSDLHPPPSRIAPDQIIEAVATHYNLNVQDLLGRSRAQEISRPRQIAMYLLRQETQASLPQIGALLGGRDHTTILHGCDHIAELIEKDADIRREIILLRQRIHEH